MATRTLDSTRTDRPGRRYSENVYFQDGRLFTGILVSLLYLILAISLDAAGYVSDMTLLVPVTLGALLLGFLMAYSRFDGFFALSHSMFTGLAWILYLMTGLVSEAELAPFQNNGIPELQARAYFILLRWLNWVDAALNNAASADNYVFIFEMSFLVWWLTYLGVWAIFRYGYTWRAVIPAGLVLLINTYYAPRSILGFLIFFCLVAMILFVRTHLAEQQIRWREQRVHYSQDITLDFLRNGFLFSALIITLAWLSPGLGHSFQVRSVMAPLNERWQETTERWNRLYQGLNRQTRPTTAAFGRTLSLGGERNVGNSIVFQVNTAQGRYWRAVVYDTYTGRQWLNTSDEELNFDAQEAVPVAGWALRRPMTQTITLMSPTGNILFGAPDIVRASVPFEALVQPLPVPSLAGPAGTDGEPAGGAVEIALARARTPLEAGDSYTVVSYYTEVTQRALRSVEEDFPPEILEKYLQLPENFSPRVTETARTVVEGQETLYDKAKAIETFLRGYTYNDAISAPPPDADPVEYFLYDIKEGYCDYYATAMAVMLRSLGIPARVVSGYAEGTYDEETGLFYITERDAHTWVEVYFPGLGWIEFEPTAGESTLNRPVGNDPILADMASTPLDTNLDPYMEEDPFAPGLDMGAESLLNEEFAMEGGTEVLVGQSRWLGALVLLGVLSAGAWLIWRTRLSGPNRFDPDLPPIFFGRLQQWAARLGLSLPPTQTPYEQERQLERALPVAREPIHTIIHSYVRYRFSRNNSGPGTSGSHPSSMDEDGRLMAAWNSLQPIFWKAWLRKMLRTILRQKVDPFSLLER